MQEQSPFAEKTWLDVRRKVGRELYRRFSGSLTEDQYEDVLGEVMVDLIGYWQQLPSSKLEQSDPARNYSFAVRRGVWRGCSEVMAVLNRQRVEQPAPGIPGSYGEDGETVEDPWESVADPGPLPDELAEQLDETERARRALAALEPGELHAFFEYLARDESERDCARRLNLSRAGVQYRARRARCALRERAGTFGLR